MLSIEGVAGGVVLLAAASTVAAKPDATAEEVRSSCTHALANWSRPI